MNRSEAGKLGRQKADITLRNKWHSIQEKYKSNPKKCKFCLALIVYKNRMNDFCNHSCAAKFNNSTRIDYEVHCIFCKKDISNKYCINAKYCSRACRINFLYKDYIEKWKRGEVDGGKNWISGYIRKYIVNKYQNKCAECGWAKINKTTGKIPLQIDHIDGNYLNNSEHNLILLCPNCHSLTPTFGNLNRGHGRKYRYNKP